MPEFYLFTEQIHFVLLRYFFGVTGVDRAAGAVIQDKSSFINSPDMVHIHQYATVDQQKRAFSLMLRW